MSRPLRVNYPFAWYHVMNRGAGRQKIFKNKLHRMIFLELLGECHKMFNAIIAAYCLMDNHYHLLICTPEGNLSRIMRHINGVYTQRFNFSSNTDGPLFRGRYRAKLVDEDCYQLIVSRYIHLNPVEAGIVTKAEDYKWSSYQAYLGFVSSPPWLSKEIILKNLSESKLLSHVENYQAYVEMQDMSDIKTFSSIKNTSPILGSVRFKEDVLGRLNEIPDPCLPDFRRARYLPELSIIFKCVSNYYGVENESLLFCKKSVLNWPHLAAIYISRKRYGYSLRSICDILKMKRQETVSAKVSKCHKELSRRKFLLGEIDAICAVIDCGAEGLGG